MLFLMPSSVKADPTTLASWTFDYQYDNSGTSGAVTYTPNATSVGTISGTTESYTFGDSYSNIKPTFIANTGSGTLKAVTGNTWSIGAGYGNQCLRLNPSSESTITDFEANSGADKHDEYFEATFSATGYCNITLNMAICYTANNNKLTNPSGIATMHVVYSTDGGTTWTDGYTYVDGGTWFTYTGRSTTIAVANKSSVIVRIVRGDGWQDASKTWNLDYLTITGDALDPAKSAITFSKPADVEGFVPASKTVDINSSFKIPTNYTLYKEGYTLTGWTDGDGSFSPGNSYTMSKTVYELSPIFTPNTVSLDDRTESVTATWNFGKKAGVPEFEFNNSTGFLVTQANVAGETIDLKMDVDATAKLGTYYAILRNTGRPDNDEWAQMEKGIKMTVPSVYGATVELKAYANMSTTTIDGSNTYSSGKIISKAVESTNSTIDVVGMDGDYYSYLSVTYPVIAVSPAKKFTTYCSTSPLDFSNVDGLEAYVVTGSTTTTITLAKVTKVPAGTGLILKKTGSAASYNVPVGTATSLAETNKLVGVTTATTFNAGDYILYNGTFIRGNAGTLAAGKAYLPAANVTAESHELLLDFGGTTGIQQVESANIKIEGYYNLNGQRVAQPTKGLYIVNGKKVIMK